MENTRQLIKKINQPFVKGDMGSSMDYCSSKMMDVKNIKDDFQRLMFVLLLVMAVAYSMV